MVKVEVVNGFVVTYTPYNKQFTTRARQLRGKWDGLQRVWVFPIEVEEDVNNLCLEIFGTTDSENTTTFNLKFLLPELVKTDILNTSELYLFGRILLKRFQYDKPVVVGDDVALISGEFERYGKNSKDTSIGKIDNIQLKVFNIPERFITDEYKKYIITGRKRKIKQNVIKASEEETVENILHFLLNNKNHIRVDHFTKLRLMKIEISCIRNNNKILT